MDLNLSLNSGSIGHQHGPPTELGRAPCSRCFSYKHIRPNCHNMIRCPSCFRLGHISTYCRFPPRFLRLHLSESLPSFPTLFHEYTGHDWFLCLTDGPGDGGPLSFPSFGHLAKALLGKSAVIAPSSIQWHLPTSATLLPASMSNLSALRNLPS